MISRATSSFNHQGFQMFPLTEDLVSPNVEVDNSDGGSGSSSSHSSSLLFYLSVLKDKLSQVQTLVGVILSPDQSLPESTSMAISSMNSTIHEIIVTATSMMLTSQQMMDPPGTTTTTNDCTNDLHHQQIAQSNFGNNDKGVLSNIAPNNENIRCQGFFPSTESEALDWFGQSYNNNSMNNINNCNLKNEVAISENNNVSQGDHGNDESYNINRGPNNSSTKNYDVIELDADDLLAKYTHHCQVCGKGFKRDANLRMHMRAHGDEYKTSDALKNSLKNSGTSLGNVKPIKYSCPQEGCRWNQKHVKFQPLKSMICAKNHYKRTHCPKMYVCKRCNQKQFSVLSDLRTHEKHCGDLKWQCSCGTTFSRKDKLMGHVTLFVGHQPATNIGL
ncbi:hypothetical protein TanjilG_30181 [Lupinus angustifolius]|uniref:C2H2-type domain-containing protein n=1 Tax=Lupinus angustifolius TaxID=3871 RepID=A0A4P1R755_LUPAN|nr:PREDICTED: zinc finger protein STOP1 homolog [Lupinus angustifolius]OIW03905.1 hypothetical protein TanjilG_30181 [Lupinus angustifolius]